LDLLPLLAEWLRREEEGADALFLDGNHLSVRGSEVVAEFIVAWLRSENAIWSRLVSACDIQVFDHMEEGDPE
jgi:hypothetical protein